MSSSTLSLAKTFLTPGRLASIPTFLMVSAFAICTTLGLVMAGGVWAFFQWQDGRGGGLETLYQVLAIMALTCVLVPAITLGQAAAKLASRQDSQRLSTLSLLGASSRTLRNVAVLEPAGLAFVGSLVGLGGYFLVLMPMSVIPFQGEPLGYAQMIMPAWALALAVTAMMGLSTLSALWGLGRVTITPLGVRTRTLTNLFPWPRVVLGASALVCLLIALPFARAGQSLVAIVVPVVMVLFLALLSIDLLGPVMVRLMATRSVARARTPHRLIAARMVLAEPGQYWRRISGVAMAAFTATFCGAGIALAASFSQESAQPMLNLSADLLTGVFITQGVTYLFIATSSVLSQCADIYDRQTTYQDLHAAGMTVQDLQRVNVAAIMLPLLWISMLSGLLGIVLGLPIVGAAVIFEPLTFLTILSSLVAGALLVRSGLWLTGRTVRSVIAPA